ncbi:MAG: DUF4062 domain-containing protein [Bacteroidales bacterium]|nr:DUF4062 domain-containing protein [Bacteroidales bacterium]
MAHTGKTFRIFISSTFTDLQEERNALQKEVFPALKKLCRDNDCQFQAIDLRWGIGEEAGIDQRTMEICLDELKRCQHTSPRPNFLLLLGNRYGWQPLPEKIPADEFEQILNHTPDLDERKLLETWYRRDDNAVFETDNITVPVHDLQPRTGEFVDFNIWENKVERNMRNILDKAEAKLSITQDKRLKYLASATEQEIYKGALSINDAREHVFCFFREFEGVLPVDKNFVDLEDDGKPDELSREKLDKLKNQLEEDLSGNIFKYKARWTEDGITKNHINDLCRDVYSSLEKVILSEIEQIKAKPYLEKEIEDHVRFGEERARVFVGRSSALETINGYISGGSNHPICIYGEGGSGKSALLAFALKQVRAENGRAEIISRFIGATPNSSIVRSLLEDLCRQISRAYGADEDIPTSYEDLVQEFPGRLALATGDKPLVLFLDSIDQLSTAYNAGSLNWLPAELPDNVKMVVSTRPGEYLVAIRNRIPQDSIYNLEPMSISEGELLLDRWLKDTGRKLQDFQKKEVLDKFSACGWPLYLKLAFEEARLWKSYTGEVSLASGTEGIIRNNLLKRLEQEHGELLVARCFGYIAATREMNGLAEDELLEVLSSDKTFFDKFLEKVKHEPPERRLPVAVWARLYFDLEPYLSERNHESTTLLTFFHRELGEVSKNKYLDKNEQSYQQVLADYLLNQADTERDPEKNMRKKTWLGSSRALSELPFHLARAERWDELFEILVDFRFLEQKAARVGVQENIDAKGNKTKSYTGPLALLEDYDLTINNLPQE